MAQRHDLTAIDEQGLTIVEGPRDAALLQGAGDVDRVLEACFTARTRAALLYAENLPPAFFDLSSGDAGAILQKLRNYGVRLAVVSGPAGVAASSRFGEMVAEERLGRHFRIFGTPQAARQWLADVVKR